jgi:hypothetical protein
MRRGIAPVLFLVSACGDGPAQSPQAAIRDSAGIQIIENTAPRWQPGQEWRLSAEPVVDIGGGETEETQLYQVAGALRMEDGRLVIANAGSAQLRFYEQDGRFQHAAGGQGGGPGEFENLYRLSRFKDSLVTFDARLNRLSFFDSEGTYGRSFLLRPMENWLNPLYYGIFADGTVLVRMARPGMYPLGHSRIAQPIFRYAVDGTTADSLTAYPELEVFTEPIGSSGRWFFNPPFARSTHTIVRGDHYYVADNASYEIRVYSASGVLERIVRKAHAPLQITPRDVAYVHDQWAALSDDPAWPPRLNAVFGKLSIPETMPAYGWNVLFKGHWVQLDDLRHLWVLEYNRPGDSSYRWNVFGPEGTWLGTVPVPRPIEPLHIGDDFVLALWKDDFDVEHIQLYDLIKPIP